MNFVAVIFARGGSKGLPGKNIRMMGGKPLIAHAIEHAHAVHRIGRVLVSTDSEEIAAVASAWGAEVPFLRPPELARDDSSEWLAWRHALMHLREATGSFPNALVTVPATAPLRIPNDIERCLDEYEAHDADVVVTVSDAHRSPYFNMVKGNPDGTVSLVISPSGAVVRRQDAPPVYDMATVAYVARSTFVIEKPGMFAGRVRAVRVPVERAIDIDTPMDFQIAEYFMAARQKDRK